MAEPSSGECIPDDVPLKSSIASTPVKSSITTHWTLWSANDCELDSSRAISLIQLSWLFVIAVGFALIGGLPALSFEGWLPDYMQPDALQLIWIFCMFATLRWVPEDHNSASIFYMHALVGCVAVDGMHRNGWRVLVTPYVTLMLPLLDWFVGIDTRKPPPKDQLKTTSFRIAALTQPIAQFGFLLWACLAILHGRHTGKMSLLEVVLSGISFGTYTGAIGITYAHELCHRHHKLDKCLGVLNLVLVCYPHFNTEHNKGHHKMMATEEDPATARAGETFYHFLPRVVIGELRSAIELEERRLRKAGKPFFHHSNELIRLFSASAAAACIIGVVFGWEAFAFFCIQSAVAVMLFESVNYLEHYGLERRQFSNDTSLPIEWRYEPVALRHSWDSPTRLGNTILLKLQRHADHHVNAGKRYQQLNTTDASPQLPGGYATMILLALVPPLWFAVMDPRLLEHRARHPRQHYRHWPIGVIPPVPNTKTDSINKSAARIIYSTAGTTQRRSSGLRPSSSTVCLDSERFTASTASTESEEPM